VSGKSKLANQQDVELGAQRAGYFKRDWDTAAGQGKYEWVRIGFLGQ
jgi:hypothetical protein